MATKALLVTSLVSDQSCPGTTLSLKTLFAEILIKTLKFSNPQGGGLTRA